MGAGVGMGDSVDEHDGPSPEMSKSLFTSSTIHNDNENDDVYDNSSSSVLTQHHPPHNATFGPHGNSAAAQMELTGQLLSTLSILADSVPRTKELHKALKESFAMVHTMTDEYIQMTKDCEEW